MVKLVDCHYCKSKSKEDEGPNFFEYVQRLEDVSLVIGYEIRCLSCGLSVQDEYGDELVDRWNGLK